MYRFIILLHIHISAMHNIGLSVNIMCQECNSNSFFFFKLQKDKLAFKNPKGVVHSTSLKNIYEYSLCLTEELNKQHRKPTKF